MDWTTLYRYPMPHEIQRAWKDYLPRDKRDAFRLLSSDTKNKVRSENIDHSAESTPVYLVYIWKNENKHNYLLSCEIDFFGKTHLRKLGVIHTTVARNTVQIRG